MTVRISPGVVLVALFFVAVGAGGAVGVMLWEPWEGDNGRTEQAVPVPQPTPDEPRLTAAEAIGLVSAGCDNAARAAALRENARATYSGDGKWKVIYTATADASTNVWTVDEVNNTAIPVGTNPMQRACDTPPRDCDSPGRVPRGCN